MPNIQWGIRTNASGYQCCEFDSVPVLDMKASDHEYLAYLNGDRVLETLVVFLNEEEQQWKVKYRPIDENEEPCGPVAFDQVEVRNIVGTPSVRCWWTWNAAAWELEVWFANFAAHAQADLIFYGRVGTPPARLKLTVKRGSQFSGCPA